MHNLTRRELEVLEQLRRGLANKELASELHVSIDTVKEHLHSIFKKLQVRNRTHAGVLAEREACARVADEFDLKAGYAIRQQAASSSRSSKN